MYLPLNTIRESRTVVRRGGVVSTYSIQEVVVCCYTHSSSPLGHGSAHAPLVGVRIEALHWPQAWAAVSTTYCKQSEILNKMCYKKFFFFKHLKCTYSGYTGSSRSSSHQLSGIDVKTDDRTVTVWQDRYSSEQWVAFFKGSFPWERSLPERSHQCFFSACSSQAQQQWK